VRGRGVPVIGSAGVIGRPVPVSLAVQLAMWAWVSSQGSARCIAVSLITAAARSGAVALAFAGRGVPALTGRLAYLAARGAGAS
jgi:hypothetical protein